MAIATTGQKANFHVLFVDEDNNPIAVNSATIEVFTFSGTTKEILVAAGTAMTAVAGVTGQYVFSYTISSTYSLNANIYGTMRGVDAQGVIYLVEQHFDVYDGSGEVIEPPPIPPPLSHWGTTDGFNTTDGLVSASGLSFSSARVATPSGGEGSPFAVGNWGNTNQNRVTRDTTVTITSAGDTTGFGGDSTMAVVVYDADYVSILDSYTTAAIASDGVLTSPSNNIVITITNYGPDNEGHTKAKASVEIDLGGIFTAQVRDGGKIGSIEVTHNVDTASDGTGSYSFTVSNFFVDTNPTTPSISGILFSETLAVTRYLSGIAYYDRTSQFTIRVLGIDQLNRNTAKTSNNLSISANGISLPNLNHSPFGTGAANFAGWTSDENVNGVSYLKTDWEITQIDYRLIAHPISATATVRDTWSNGNSLTTNIFEVLIDTFDIASTTTQEFFEDEDKRMESDYTTSWNSLSVLVQGEALVHNGRLQVPHTDWSSYFPTQANPDYSNLSAPASYFRNFITPNTTQSYSGFSITVNGNFVVDLQTDLQNNDLQIFVRRIASSVGGFGPNANPLLVHGQNYNNTLFDDGATNGHIREFVSGNTISCTFGGAGMKKGVHIEIKIANPTITINSFLVSF